MEGKFIYVFDVADRDTLLERGYFMVYSNDESHIYAFVNDNTLSFASCKFDVSTRRCFLWDYVGFRRHYHDTEIA